MGSKRTHTLSIVLFGGVCFLMGWFLSAYVLRLKKDKNIHDSASVMAKRMEAINQAIKNKTQDYNFTIETPPHLK